jgi:hypothetical protein
MNDTFRKFENLRVFCCRMTTSLCARTKITKCWLAYINASPFSPSKIVSIQIDNKISEIDLEYPCLHHRGNYGKAFRYFNRP